MKHVNQADDSVRQQLSQNQLEPAERCDVELLERSNLSLAHDRHRRKVRRDDEQQQRKDAGQHEVAAFERRVEPHAHAGLDAIAPARLRRQPAGAHALFDQLLRIGRRSSSSRTPSRCSSSSHPIRLPRPAASPAGLWPRSPAVPGRYRQRHPRVARLEIAIHLSRVRHDVDDLENPGSDKLADEILAARAAIHVDDDDGHVPNVCRRSISQDRELKDRCKENDAEDARILPQLEHLLPHHEEDPSHAHCRFRRIDASVSMSAAYTASADKLGPECRQLGALQDNRAKRHDEIPRGHDERDRLNRRRHARNRKHESRKHHRRQKRRQHRELKRHLLRLGERRDHQPQAKGPGQIQRQRQKQEQPRPVHRKIEQHHRGEHDEDRRGERDDEIRQRLADDVRPGDRAAPCAPAPWCRALSRARPRATSK